jgi:hypothetical protein
MIYFQVVKVEVCSFENPSFVLQIDTYCRAVPQLWSIWILGENSGSYYISVTLQGWLQGEGSGACSAGRAADPSTTTTAKQVLPSLRGLAGEGRTWKRLKQQQSKHHCAWTCVCVQCVCARLVAHKVFSSCHKPQTFINSVLLRTSRLSRDSRTVSYVRSYDIIAFVGRVYDIVASNA